jgi:aminomuconate-semialdehyde/2-hydroxymuconate-6-semialdehyde dehydrogenase
MPPNTAFYGSIVKIYDFVVLSCNTYICSMNLQIPQKIQNYIGGEFMAPVKVQYIDNINPATGAVYSQIPNSTQEDVDLAVQAAAKALPEWSNSTPEFRFRILNKMAELIEANLDFLAEAETNDNGKPLSLSKHVDIPRAAENLRFFATSALHFASESHNMPGKAINYTLRKPVGIVACICHCICLRGR